MTVISNTSPISDQRSGDHWACPPFENIDPLRVSLQALEVCGGLV
jgi:hypothetical protein